MGGLISLKRSNRSEVIMNNSETSTQDDPEEKEPAYDEENDRPCMP